MNLCYSKSFNFESDATAIAEAFLKFASNESEALTPASSMPSVRAQLVEYPDLAMQMTKLKINFDELNGKSESSEEKLELSN